MNTCCFLTLISVLLVIGILCLIAVAVIVFAIHKDLNDIKRSIEN